MFFSLSFISKFQIKSRITILSDIILIHLTLKHLLEIIDIMYVMKKEFSLNLKNH